MSAELKISVHRRGAEGAEKRDRRFFERWWKSLTMEQAIELNAAIQRIYFSDVSRIVSAAMMMDDGSIIAGVRHFSPDMRATLHRLYGAGYHLRVREQGFIDTKGHFLNRQRAWRRAVITGQILNRVSTPGTLYSENLY